MKQQKMLDFFFIALFVQREFHITTHIRMQNPQRSDRKKQKKMYIFKTYLRSCFSGDLVFKYL